MAFQQYQQINTVMGFNYMAVNGLAVAPDREIFLRQPGGGYLSLGTFAQAAARAPYGGGALIGVNGVPLGQFGTPQIDNNLFVRVQVPGAAAGIAAPAAGGRSRRFKRSRRSRRSHRSRKARRSRKR